jgi:hypothetical protein
MLLIAGMFFSFASQGQSQRLMLFEEFTGENCPPCAVYNSGLNQLLDANAQKIVSIKYQTDIPFGTPKLYDYNPADVDDASIYYSNSSAPYGHMDGNTWSGPVFGFNQATIDARYAVPSPFAILVSHAFSDAHDTVFTLIVITATQAISGMPQLRAKIAVTEKDITGFTSYNGENHFQNVMQKLLPDAVGTALPADWAVGDSVVIEAQWEIYGGDPTPDWAQLEVVGFVQNETTKEVMQTGFSPALITTSTPNPTFGEKEISVWPNPVADMLSIQADFEHPTDVSISMVDARGASPLCPIHLHDVTMLNEQIPLSSMLPTGVYILKVQTDENVIAVRKVIVQ